MGKIIFKNSENLTNVMRGESKRVLKVISNDGEWGSELSESLLANLSYTISLNQLDDEVDSKFINNNEEVALDKFTVNKTMKHSCLLHLSRVWEFERTVDFAGRALLEIEKYEKEFGKSAIFFNQEEVKAAIIGVSSGGKSLFSARFKVKVFVEYASFYKKSSGAENSWLKYHKIKDLGELLGSAEKSRNITKKDLLELFDDMTNNQDGIVSILIFEGIKMSAIRSQNEISHLKASDIDYNQGRIFIGGENSRTIEMDREVLRRLKLAEVGTFSLIRGTKPYIAELAETPYILRTVKAKKPADEETGMISPSGLYKRMEVINSNISALYPDVDEVTATYISQCGKSHYISKYMNDGYSEKESVVKTLKRFGEWNYHENTSSELEDGTNLSRISRLLHSYKIFN